jgi:DNA primase
MTAKVEAVLNRLKIQFEPKPRHGRLWARCPYHEDSEASWFIRVAPREKYGLQHCFSCKEGGSLVDLVAYARGISVTSAKEWLDTFEEQVADIEPAPDLVRVEEIRATKTFRMPKEVIFEPLHQWVTPARCYMTDNRHITPWQVNLHRLGYAVDGRLAGRIVIPVWKPNGQPACYQARDFCDREKRYLFPFADENPDLDTLFGEHQWTTHRACVVVTEGAFDALAVERAIPDKSGIAFAAIGNSSFRSAHAFKLATFSRVVLLTDADPAGDNIAEELQAALSRHTGVKRLRLVDGDANDQPEWHLRTLLRVVCS